MVASGTLGLYDFGRNSRHPYGNAPSRTIMNTAHIDNMITYLEGLEPESSKPLWSFNEIFATPGVDPSHYPWDGSVESLLKYCKGFNTRLVIHASYGYINGVLQGTNVVALHHHPLSSGGGPHWYGAHGDLAIAIAISILKYTKATGSWKRSNENGQADGL